MAAVAPRKPVSNIAIAFAAKSRDGLIAANATAGVTSNPSGLPADQLLTPPNSISPTLPPRVAADRQHDLTPSSHVESDIDLQDAVEHAAAQDQPTALSSAALSGLEAVGAITPAMLAKHHLPDILLANGPMAIRHILSYLAQSVPGFSRIAPAKARRLVVSALESRGGSGPRGDVEFEKVGWGRWDARTRGQTSRDGRPSASIPVLTGSLSGARLSPPASIADSYTMSSAGGFQVPRAQRDRRGDIYSRSYASNSMLSRSEDRSEDLDMAEHEADKMSLDGSEGSDTSASDRDIPGLEEDLDDDTDEEDWAAIGAAALRRGSNVPRPRHPQRGYSAISHSSTARRKSNGGLAKSVPHHHTYRAHHAPHSFSHASLQARRTASASTMAAATVSPAKPISTGFPTSSLRASSGVNQDSSMNMELDGQDSQERAAIEALLKLGSM